MKKFYLSLLAVAMIITSSFAVILNPTNQDVPTISKELLSVEDVCVVMSNPVIFTCEMSETEVSTAKQAGVELFIDGLNASAMAIAAKVTDVYPFNVTTGRIAGAAVATFTNVVSSRNMVIYNGLGTESITEGITYVIADTGLGLVSPTLAAGALVYNVPQNSASVIATLKVVSNNGVSVLDTGEGNVGTVAQQYGLYVSRQADEYIDPANEFFTFNDDKISDTIAFKFADAASNFGARMLGYAKKIDYPATTTKVTALLVYDQNLTEYKFTLRTFPTNLGSINPVSISDFNISYAASTNINSGRYTTILTKTNDNAQAMDTTNFTFSGDVMFVGATKPYILADSIDAGAWSVDGFYAQIPNVRNNTSFTTYINITNSSSIDTDVIFTILPESDGVNAGEDICRSNEGIVPSDTSRKFNVANILANSDCSDVVKAGVNMAIEINMVTDLEKVYINAYTKSTNFSKFIVLPVYKNKKWVRVGFVG